MTARDAPGRLPGRGAASSPSTAPACRSPTDVPVVTLGEGGTPLLPAPVLSELTGCYGLPQGRGRQPDRLVQGPRHDGRGHAGRRPRRQDGHLRLDRQHQRQRRRLRRAGRPGLRGAGARRATIALGKLAQALAHGARLLQVDGNFDDCLELVRKLAADYPVALVNSVNTERLQGQKTASFEIVDALGDAPDVHCLPVGNAGNIAAYWLGYQEYLADGRASEDAADARLPGRRRGADRARRSRCSSPVTVATAIRIGNPASWHLAEARQRRVRRADRLGDRRADPGRLPAAGQRERACSASRPRRLASPGCSRPAANGQVAAGLGGRLHDHRARPQGPRHRGGRRARSAETIAGRRRRRGRRPGPAMT